MKFITPWMIQSNDGRSSELAPQREMRDSPHKVGSPLLTDLAITMSIMILNRHSKGTIASVCPDVTQRNPPRLRALDGFLFIIRATI
jgi:hypothetical protein